MRSTIGETDRAEGTFWGRQALVAAIAMGSVLVPAACSDTDTAQDQQFAPTTTVVEESDRDTELRISSEIIRDELKPEVEYFVSALGGDETGLVQKTAFALNDEYAPEGSVQVSYTVVSRKDAMELRVNATGQQEPGHPDVIQHGTLSSVSMELVVPGAGEVSNENLQGDKVLQNLTVNFDLDSSTYAAGMDADGAFDSRKRPDDRAYASMTARRASQTATDFYREFVGPK